jgi:hypothetical protein
MPQRQRPRRPALGPGIFRLAKSLGLRSPSYNQTISNCRPDGRMDVRSAEGVPSTLPDKTRTTKVDQNTSAARSKDNVLVLDISVNFATMLEQSHGKYHTENTYSF